MKPIHNLREDTGDIDKVVIPHKVNDFYETNSQHFRNNGIVVIPHKVNDLIETNSQLTLAFWFHSFVVSHHKVNDFNETFISCWKQYI